MKIDELKGAELPPEDDMDNRKVDKRSMLIWVAIVFFIPLPIITWFGMDLLMGLYPEQQEWLEYGQVGGFLILQVVSMFAFVMIPQKASRRLQRHFIKTNNLLYDSARRDCQCVLAESQGQQFAFIQAVDVGPDGQDAPLIKRYWGLYNPQSPEDSITLILEHGGKWPQLPE